MRDPPEGFFDRNCAIAKPIPVDHVIGDHPLHIFPRLGKGDRLDPTDRIGL